VGPGQFINILILEYTPDWVQSIFQVGESLAIMARNLTVGGEIQINEATEGAGGVFNLQGTEMWNKYMFTWKLGVCDWQTDTDPCCGRNVFYSDDPNNPLDVASGAFTGTATPIQASGRILYTMAVNEHVQSVNYGNILLYLLQQVVFPAITDLPAPVSFSDALISLLPMENIACWIGDLLTSTDYDTCIATCQIVKNPSTGQWESQNCNSDMATTFINLAALAGDQFDDWMTSLSTSGSEIYNFTIETDDSPGVSNTLEDVNHDLQTDRMDLVLIGEVHYGSTTGDSSAMSGTLMAEEMLPACKSDSDCEGNTTCQIKVGLVDECQERLRCTRNVGNRDGGQQCSNDSYCKSGYCMSNSKCFSACETNGDCPGSAYTCMPDYTDFDFGNGYHADVNACVQ